ncbi:DUF1883 domain-containing protein [Mycobacteroides immunogenum]|uniref:Galactose oxidase-like Early set domain-containing protein n=3 Tax=Mycobacteroides immunogenum TaxID=83262 RepID=A0ABR5LUF7_9MYCO|nr:DUF1883 domain-containing protein [Mycobacteroides immunogenum]AMT69958.1 hypothetical protein ABG82_06005 [Mycobacteroides immunogenum]ANO03015.1 hypothetical protein BAB75_06040 [Mycobacteroides immunogenum]KPG05485.1 hypothetical protein AN909_20990 [Mycobacteroides immunogenum]KPG34862.1 hypothetical protein AN912_09400 [Mycobacteroides immunogenum]KPG38603.1 hypothetical protein AN914_12080 [Mycobacteroides immunogenum]
MKVPYMNLGQQPAGTVVEVIMQGGEAFVEVLDDQNLGLLTSGQVHTYFGGPISGTFQCTLPTTGIWYVLGIATAGPTQAQIFTTAPTPNGARLPWAQDAQPIELQNGEVPDGTATAVDEPVNPGDTPSDPLTHTYTASQFNQTAIEVGGGPGFDLAHNAQGIRADEGVLIQDGRIMFGDAAQVASGRYGDLPYINTPMYKYHLNENGMPILDGPPLPIPEADIELGRRIIPIGSTGPNPMPNGQGLLFGAVWGDPAKPGKNDSDFRPDTLVYDTRRQGPFTSVATIKGLRMVTAIPFGDNQLLISGVSGEGSNVSRKLFLTPPQQKPGDWSFLDQQHWTRMPGEFLVNDDASADIASSLFRFETPTGTQYGLLTPNLDNSGIDMRLSATPEGLMSALPQHVVPTGTMPWTFLYAPTKTQITPLPDGSYDMAMTFSARQIPDGVDPKQIGSQTYENVFGHVMILPSQTIQDN